MHAHTDLNIQNAIFLMSYEPEHYVSKLKIHRKKTPALDFNFSLKSGCLHQILFQPENTSGNLPVLLRIAVVFLCAGEELVVFEARPKNMSRL